MMVSLLLIKFMFIVYACVMLSHLQSTVFLCYCVIHKLRLLSILPVSVLIFRQKLLHGAAGRYFCVAERKVSLIDVEQKWYKSGTVKK